EIALGILDDLRCLRYLDRGGAVDAGIYHHLIDSRDAIQRLSILAGDHFDDLLKRVLLVAGVDSLWRVAELEIYSLLEAGHPLNDGPANFLRDSGVDGGLEDDDRSGTDDFADRLGCPLERKEIGALGGIDRGGDGDDE